MKFIVKLNFLIYIINKFIFFSVNDYFSNEVEYLSILISYFDQVESLVSTLKMDFRFLSSIGLGG